MTTPKWTDDDLTLMWELGRDYQQNQLDNLADDLNHTTTRPPSIPYEQRVADRLAKLAPTDTNWLRASADRNREHDRLVLARCPPEPAYTTWEELHAAVEPRVWRRVFYDLAPTTRDRLADQGIAPADYNPTLLAQLEQDGGGE